MGESGSHAFRAGISVININAVVYDFVTNAPYAQWKSGAGILPYPGTTCKFGATGCYVTFLIDYLLPNGVQKRSGAGRRHTTSASTVSAWIWLRWRDKG